MGLPQIPQHANVSSDLLESIALEEAALAAILNAEAEKLQKLADHLPVPCNMEQVLDFQKITLAIIQAVQLKEMILSDKLDKVRDCFSER